MARDDDVQPLPLHEFAERDEDLDGGGHGWQCCAVLRQVFSAQPVHIVADGEPGVADAQDNQQMLDQHHGHVRLMAAHQRLPRKTLALVLMVLGELWFSFMALLVKIVGDTLPVFEMVLVRGVLVWVVSVVSLHFLRCGWWGPRAARRFLVLKGILGFVSVSSVYFAITHMPLGDAVVLSFTSPVWASILAACLLREKMDLWDGAATLCSLAGVALVARPPFLFGRDSEEGSASGTAVVVALVGSWAAAGSFICMRVIGPSVNSLVLVQYHALAGALLALPAAFIFDPLHTPKGLFWVALPGIALLALLGQWFVSRSLQLGKTATVTSVKYSQIPFAFTWQIVFLGHSPKLYSVLGALLILLCTVTLSVKKCRGTH